MVATLQKSDIFYPEQWQAYEKVVGQRGGIVWMDVGQGKTRVGIMSALDLSPDHPVVVVVARRQAFYDWEQEIATLQLNVDTMLIEDVPLTHQFFSKKTFVLVSEGSVAKDSVQMVLHSLESNNALGAIIIDEGYLFKNPKAKRHLAIRPFAFRHPTVLLSGSVMSARDLVEIFGQVSAAGRMKQLARNLTSFREQFQTGINGAYFSWYPKPGAYKAIMEKIEPFTYVYFPPRGCHQIKDSILKVPPTKQQLAYFKELKETAAIEDKFELNNMATVITKAQQISNGWFKLDNGEYETFKSNKVERTVALASEVLESDPKRKLVIWCAFRYDIVRLMPEVQRLCRVATLQSGTDFDVRHWSKQDTRICLATEASGSSINHFAQCDHGIYFSQDFKWESLKQSRGRHTRRSSQHNTTHFTFLHTEKSLDAQVYYTVISARSSESSFLRQMDVLGWLKK